MKQNKTYLHLGVTLIVSACAVLMFYDTFFQSRVLLDFFDKLKCPPGKRSGGHLRLSKNKFFDRITSGLHALPTVAHLPGSRYFFRRTCRRKKCDLFFTVRAMDE